MTNKKEPEMPFLGGSLWAWAVGAVVAGLTIIGAATWSGSPSVEPVGITADEAADPASGTAPKDRSPGDIIRNQLDPRSR